MHVQTFINFSTDLLLLELFQSDSSCPVWACQNFTGLRDSLREAVRRYSLGFSGVYTTKVFIFSISPYLILIQFAAGVLIFFLL